MGARASDVRVGKVGWFVVIGEVAAMAVVGMTSPAPG